VPTAAVSEAVQADQADTPEDPDDSARRARDKAALRYVLIAHKVVPFLWVGQGALSLGSGNPWPALLGAAGTFGLGALGLRRAYRSTVRFYRGQSVVEKPKPEVNPKTDNRPAIVRGNFLARRVPWVSQEASAMALATFRSLARASEVKMSLATGYMIMLIFGGMLLLRGAGSTDAAFRSFFATGAVAVTVFGLSQLMSNLFGFDRDGFRSLVLLPMPREQVLLGKNLAFLPVAAVMGMIMLTVVAAITKVLMFVVLASVLQLISGFLILSIVGCLVSILVPYHIAPGSMKPAKMSTETKVLLIVSRLVLLAAMGPVFVMPWLGLLFSKAGWLPAGPANLLFSALLLVVAVVGYRWSLAPLGRLLQKRERTLLQVVTHEVE